MRLSSFSVANYRSIGDTKSIPMGDLTTLIGKNNEGKSNFLKGLEVAISLLENATGLHKSGFARPGWRRFYDWDSDFPIDLQSKRTKKISRFKLEFEFSEREIDDFKNEIGSKLNGLLAFEISVPHGGNPTVELKKSGPYGKSLRSKVKQCARFVCERTKFVYIPAVRTEKDAIDIVSRMIDLRLQPLDHSDVYQDAIKKISALQQPILDSISDQVLTNLQTFLPDISAVELKVYEDLRRRSLRSNVGIFIDDGVKTNLTYKGDGVKSLVALSLLSNRQTDEQSIIAIEEPECHLHPSAVHQIKSIIGDIASRDQVIVSTHNPLFANRGNLRANVIVDQGTVRVARGIDDVRNTLGVRVSDNLRSAHVVLLVEGMCDKKIVLHALEHRNSNAWKAVVDGRIQIEPTGSASKMPTRVAQHQLEVSKCFVLTDGDNEANTAIKKILGEKLLEIKDIIRLSKQGHKEVEIEDFLDADFVATQVGGFFGLSPTRLRGSKKFSIKIKELCAKHSLHFDNDVLQQLKKDISEAVEASPHPLVSPSEPTFERLDELLAGAASE